MFWYPKEKDFGVRDPEGVTLRDFLETYNPDAYDRPAVTVDNLIFQKEDGGLKILLIRRGRHPYYGMLGLPGGFIEMNETLEDAAARELFEETGVAGIPLKQLGAYGSIGRDPRLRIVSVAYVSVLSKDTAVQAGDDAAEAGFYGVTLQKKMNGLETNYELRFNNGQASAGATITENAGKRTITDSGLSSDHALMVLDALLKLDAADAM